MLVHSDPITDAILALRSKGHTVEPSRDDPAVWRVDDEEQELGMDQLLTLALRLGLAEGPGRTQ